MRFNEEVVRFSFAGIPMVGNLENGYAIGLTSDGANLCDRLSREDIGEDEIIAVDELLFKHLDQAGFFDPPQDRTGLKGAYVHVTQRCNLDCLGCYSYDDTRSTSSDAPTKSFKHVFDELGRAGIDSLVISGGEPFLRKDLAELVTYAKKDCGIGHISVLSNGTCLDLGLLRQMAPCVDRVSVSFDGCSAESPALIRGKQRFSELVEAVRIIQDHGIESHIIATIHSGNIEDISGYNELAKKLGVTLSLSLLTCPAASEGLGALAPNEDDLRALGKTLLELGGDEQIVVLDSPVGVGINVKRNCGVGRRTISVAADGTVYPCHILHTPEITMGNLFEGNIEDILHGDFAMMLEDLDVRDFKECGACDYRLICGGGCRGRSFSSFGDLVSKDGYCSMITEFYDGLGQRLSALYSS